MKNTLIGSIATLFLFACSQTPNEGYNPMGPSGTIVGPMTQTTTEIGSVAVPDEPNSCELIGLHRAGIEHEVDELTLKLFVPADNADFVNVWTPKVNDGVLLKKCPVNEWCEYTFKEAGTYKLQLAVGKEGPTGIVYWCNRHKLTVTTKKKKCPENSYIRFEFFFPFPNDSMFCDDSGNIILTYGVTTNLPRFKVTVPDECVGTVCTFPTAKSRYYVQGAATGYYNGRACGTSIASFPIEPCHQ